jgi:hypothetical protein
MTATKEPFILKRFATVQFEPSFEDYMNELAKKKLAIMLNKGRSIKNWSLRMSPIQKEMIGIAGEFAAAKLLNLPAPDPELIASTENYDLVFNNLTIDVKATTATSPHLACPKHIIDRKESFADHYFLIKQNSFLKYTFFGSCKKEDLIRPENLGFFKGYTRESYMMKYTKLTDFICERNNE